MRYTAICSLVLLLAGGCASEYSWKSDVPQQMRTVFVPVFRNESEITEFGSLAARQILREFQREGTFSIGMPGSSAIEIQGVIKKSTGSTSDFYHGTGIRLSNIDLSVSAEISVVDKTKGKVIVDNKYYEARTTFIQNDDFHTSRRDASGRLAEDLARQVVDDVLSLKW
jgi:hypothetical protein